jgi:hypothetical protein
MMSISSIAHAASGRGSPPRGTDCGLHGTTVL